MKYKLKIVILLVLLIICCLSTINNNSISNNISIKPINSYKIDNKSSNTKENDCIGKINISKIKLNTKLYKKDSKLNNVNKNVMILEESSYPNEKNSNLILAAHSGFSKKAYFNNLKYLDIGDVIDITYKEKLYQYELTNIYEIEKTGTARIIRNINKSTITLITCKHNTNKQLIFIGELIVL